VGTGEDLLTGKGTIVTYADRLQRQRCKACWHADGFDFNVPTWVWEAVVPPELRDHVVCLSCFDDFAAAAGVDYQDHLGSELYFAGGEVALVLRIEGRAKSSCR
jgi:hypothetical protein